MSELSSSKSPFFGIRAVAGTVNLEALLKTPGFSMLLMLSAMACYSFSFKAVEDSYSISNLLSTLLNLTGGST